VRLWPSFLRRRRKPRILALLACRNEMAWLPDYFESAFASAAPLVDGVVALDDGSTDGSADYLAGRPEVVRLVRLPPREDHLWDDGLNHRRLVEASWDLRPDWLLGLDADERLEHGFRERAEEEIARAAREGHRAYRIHIREIWDHPLQFRADGLWGKKSGSRLFEARRDHEFHQQRLHCHWAPLNSRENGDFPQADLFLYHLKMLTPESRAARRARYENLDPDRRFQTIGYSYLTDTEGIRLERIAPGREYQPVRG
jgi:glycosyltransferase involved in cell wall biosynthesis